MHCAPAAREMLEMLKVVAPICAFVATPAHVPPIDRGAATCIFSIVSVKAIPVMPAGRTSAGLGF